MGKRNTFIFLWLVTVGLFAWLIYQGNHTFDAPSTRYVLLVLLICTIALLRWLPGPTKEIPSEGNQSWRGRLTILVILAVGGLFLARTIIGPPLLYAFPILAVAILVYLKPRITQQEAMYAVVLVLLAGLTGLGAGWVPFNPIVWSILQVFLVSSSLLAGWSLLRHTGLWQIGIARSQFLDKGTKLALRDFGFGIIMSLPWAFGIVLIGGTESQQWVQQWWQPFMAINPGIAEEAWGRILLIPSLFIMFRIIVSPKKAYILALFFGTYWFAYLHTDGGVGGFISTVLIGTLFGLPLTYICFHRNLETAIGFHFFVDFIKFTAALFLNAGIWFS